MATVQEQLLKLANDWERIEASPRPTTLRAHGRLMARMLRELAADPPLALSRASTTTVGPAPAQETERGR